MNSYPARSKQWYRVIALLIAVMSGSVGSHAVNASAHDSQEADEVSEERSLPDVALTPSGRTILLIESKEAPVVVAEEQALPDFALTSNGRSIQMIESKEGPTEFALPRYRPF